MGKFANVLDKPGVQRATAWIGLLGFLIGQLYLRRNEHSIFLT